MTEQEDRTITINEDMKVYEILSKCCEDIEYENNPFIYKKCYNEYNKDNNNVYIPICYNCLKKINNKKKKKVKKMANLYKMAEKYRFDVPKSGHFVIEKKDANKGQKKRGDKK